MLRKDLEDQISAKLASLSNEDAQRIAEEYVRIRYPERFPYFGFRAFSPEGKSRPGWPDAFSVGINGKFEGVEATHTANRSGVVAHLEEYLAKAGELRADQLGGFVHISVSPKAAFEPQEIKDWTSKFVEAGFKADRVELVFGQTLVNTLTRPEFAQTRIEVLGIEDLPTYFSLYRPQVGPDERRLGTRLIPSWEDFEAGRIHRPELAETVTEALSRDRVALVRGIGASGKTVMAWLLAQDVLAQGLPAYSFDFAKLPNETPDLINLLVSDVKRFAHPEVLFVVDNIHIDEVSAKALYVAWEEIPLAQRPQLLLIGRETRTAKGSAIASVNLDPLPLRARQPELRGVFRRLALRQNTDEHVPDPPETVLSNWLSVFGGDPENTETTADLIAFSTAALRRLSDLCRGRWKLTHEDATEEVREAYLRMLSPPEQENLIRVCVAQEFEMPLPNDALADKSAALTKCNAEIGIIFRDEYGTHGQYVFYRLAHAALGELLLASIAGDIDRFAILREIAFAEPRGGTILASRISRAGRQDVADSLIASIIATPDVFLKCPTVGQFLHTLRLAEYFAVELPTDFDASLTDTDKKVHLLAQIALRPPLAHLATFLRYAEKSLPQTFTALETALSDPENFPGLVDAALHTPLADLATFLRYAEKSLPQTFTALETALSDPENFPGLVDAALHTPLADLATFLRYAEKSLGEVFKYLEEHFSSEVGIETIAEAMVDEKISSLVSVLRAGVCNTAFKEAFSRIELEKWEEQRAIETSPTIDSFVAFQRIAYEGDKAELSIRPALKILEKSTQAEWNTNSLGLHHLSHVLRLASEASAEQKQAFVVRVATPEWLDTRYETVSAGGLAGNLHALSKFLPNDAYGHFNRASLRQRIVSELCSAVDPKSRAEALSLLGSATQMNVECDTGDVVWPDATELENVLRLRAPAPDRESIGVMEVQLWLGLRMMATVSETPPPVPAELGERVLELWQASQAQLAEEEASEKVIEINNKVIPWLEACKSNDWKLVPPQDPV